MEFKHVLETLNAKIISYLRMFFNSEKVFAFRGPIKYFESAPPELHQSGDGKQKILSPA